jgi:hypothetical protein
MLIFGASVFGSTSAVFLAMPSSAGDASFFGGTVYSSGPDSLSVNPAGLTGLKTGGAQFSLFLLPAGQTWNHIALGYRLAGVGVISAGAVFMNKESFSLTDPAGDASGEISSGTYSCQIGFAREFIPDRLSAGLGLKIIGESLVSGQDSASGTGAALDLGINTRGYFLKDLRLGACLRNTGIMGWKGGTGGGLPLNAVLGAGYEKDLNGFVSGIRGSLETTWDISAGFGAGLGLAIGLREISGFRTLVRAGYGLAFNGDSALAGLVFGFGAGFKGGSLDYAILPVASLGGQHRFSIGWGF